MKKLHWKHRLRPLTLFLISTHGNKHSIFQSQVQDGAIHTLPLAAAAENHHHHQEGGARIDTIEAAVGNLTAEVKQLAKKFETSSRAAAPTCDDATEKWLRDYNFRVIAMS